MKILIAEDDPLFAQNLEMIVEELGYELIKITDNAEEMLRLVVATQPDLVLMDIHIRGSLDGIQVAEKIAQGERVVPVIFVTSMQDMQTFERAKKTVPFAYITKPFEPEVLQRAIELALYRSDQKAMDTFKGWEHDLLVRDSFFIKTDQRVVKVKVLDILYLEVEERHTKLVTVEEALFAKMSLNQILEKLPISDFVRIHRNYIINANFIKEIDIENNEVRLHASVLPISKQYKTALLNRLNML